MLKRIAKALIRRDEKYLVLLRPEDSKRYANMWDLPGGKLEEDEDDITGLLREINEETALSVEVENLEFSFETDEISVKIYNAVTDTTSCCCLNPEHKKCKWITLEELKLLPNCEITLENYIKTITNN